MPFVTDAKLDSITNKAWQALMTKRYKKAKRHFKHLILLSRLFSGKYTAFGLLVREDGLRGLAGTILSEADYDPHQPSAPTKSQLRAFSKAEKYLEKAIEIDLELDQFTNAAARLMELANIPYYRGDYDNTELLLKKAQGTFRKGNKIRGEENVVLGTEAAILGSLAILEFGRGDYDKSEQLRLREQQILRKLIPLDEKMHLGHNPHGSKFSLARSLDALGNVYHKKEQYEKQVEVCKQAAIIWREIGIPLPQNYIESGVDGLQDLIPGVCEFIDSNGDQCAGELSTGSIYCFAHKYTVKFDDAQKKPSFTGPDGQPPADNSPPSSNSASSQPSSSGGSGFWGAIGAFAGGFLGSSAGHGSSSSGNTWQCIMGHTMTSTFNPGSCSWCGNAMFPK
jgi:tetratricopeptide (TPR) repeat protein